MSKKRKFYRTVIELEVLSEEPLNDATMGDIDYGINEGGYSGRYVTKIQDQEVDGKTMAELLLEQGSDTEFFNLDENGKDIE